MPQEGESLRRPSRSSVRWILADAQRLGIIFDLKRRDLVGRQNLHPLRDNALLGRLAIKAHTALKRVKAVLEHGFSRKAARKMGVHARGSASGSMGVREFASNCGFSQSAFKRLTHRRRRGSFARTPFRRRIGCIEPVGAFDMGLLKPIQGSFFLANADRNDGFDPGRVQERVAKIVAVKLQEPAKRRTKLCRRLSSVMK